MLTLTRSVGESIRIGDDIEVHVIEVRGGTVRLGFSAPREVAIHREEVYQQILEVRAVTSALTADVAAALAASLPGSAPAPAPAEAAPPPASAVPTATVRAPVPEGAGALGDRPASPSGDVVMPLSGTARPSPARMPKRAPGD